MRHEFYKQDPQQMDSCLQLCCNMKVLSHMGDLAFQIAYLSKMDVTTQVCNKREDQYKTSPEQFYKCMPVWKISKQHEAYQTVKESMK